MYSKNFSFSPGFGMPGRAYLSRVPSWENNLTILKPEQFARVGGAKIYGVNTSLYIPINTPIGTMVVAFYSTRNLSRDVLYEKKCIERLWKLKPEPKWKLTIDVGLKTTTNEGQEVPLPQAIPTKDWANKKPSIPHPSIPHGYKEITTSREATSGFETYNKNAPPDQGIQLCAPQGPTLLERAIPSSSSRKIYAP